MGGDCFCGNKKVPYYFLLYIYGMNSTDSPYTYLATNVRYIPFRLFSAGTKPGWFGRLLIKLRLKGLEKLGYCHTEFPIVLNTDVLKPGDRICCADIPSVHFKIQTLPVSSDGGYKYYVQYIHRELHAYVPSPAVRPGNRYMMVWSYEENPILAK